MPSHVGRLTPPKNQRPVPVTELTGTLDPVTGIRSFGGSVLNSMAVGSPPVGPGAPSVSSPPQQADDATRRAVSIFGAEHGLSPASAATQLGLLMQSAQAASPGGPSFLRVSPHIQFRFGGAGTGQAGNQITVDEGPFQNNLDPGTLFSQGGSLFSTSVDPSRRGPFLSPLLDPSGEPAVAPRGLVSGATGPPLTPGVTGPTGATGPTALGRSLPPIDPAGFAGAREVFNTDLTAPTFPQADGSSQTSSPASTALGRSLPPIGANGQTGSTNLGSSQVVDPAGLASALTGTAPGGPAAVAGATVAPRSLTSPTTRRSLGAPAATPAGNFFGNLGNLFGPPQQQARPGEELVTLENVNSTNAREGAHVDTGNGRSGVIDFALKGQRTQSGLGANRQKNDNIRATNAFFGLDPETGERSRFETETTTKDFDIQAEAEAGGIAEENLNISRAQDFLKAISGVPAPQFNFAVDPTLQAIRQSILDTINDPSVLSEEAIAGLKSQARERIQAGQRSAQQQVRQSLASRGILDSGLATSAVRAGAEQVALGTARAERDIDVESALLNADRLAQAQQLGLGLTGQLGSFGLGGAQLGLGVRAQDIGLAGGLAGLEAGRPVFVRDTLSEKLFFEGRQRLEEDIGRKLTAEENQGIANMGAALFEVFLQLALGD